MRHAYFPISGLISLEASVDTHAGLEVGMVGREGMLGAHLAHGIALAPWRALVHSPGVTRRVESGALRAESFHMPALQRVLSRYTYVTLAQFAMSMGCQRFHLLGARLSRWLLMRHDRAMSDHFFVTHETLGQMLGVRRVSVTIAAGALQNQGFIAYSRGMLSVLDRHGLESAACSCYARDRRLYAQFLPSLDQAGQGDQAHRVLR